MFWKGLLDVSGRVSRLQRCVLQKNTLLCAKVQPMFAAKRSKIVTWSFENELVICWILGEES
jgi:hypothetical protein